MQYDRQTLIQLVRELALEFGDFTLASGNKASFYLDCRKVTLDGRGANVVAAGMLELLAKDLPDAVGGMAIGADPITAAVITCAFQQGINLKGFIVRKEAKQHGKGRAVEGPVAAQQKCVILEDVVTTGGSSLKAIDQVEEFGMKVTKVLAILDREAGAAECFKERGIDFECLLRISDVMTSEELGN